MDEKKHVIPVLSIDEIGRVVADIVERDLKGWGNKGLLVSTRGELVDITDRIERAKTHRWPNILGARIEAIESMAINGSYKLFEPYRDGDYVEITGYPIINVFRGVLDIRMEVLSVQALENQEQKQQRHQNKAQSVSLAALRPTRNPFPLQSRVSIDLIYSSASEAKVNDDFLRGLRDQRAYCDIKAITIRMTSAEQIAAAIEQSNSELLVIIRGGGADSEFSVFNDPIVLNALSKSKAYRVVGLGHSANSTMLDLIADYSASVPADAGMHIYTQLENIESLIGKYESQSGKMQYRIKKLQEERDRALRNAEKNAEALRSGAGFSQDAEFSAATTNKQPIYLLIIGILLLILLFK